MSALPDTLLRYRRMTASDLAVVTRIEESIYAHPWTPGNFSDSLTAGYHCWIVECGRDIAGYTVVAVAAEEAHLLNLSIAGPFQRRGLGRELLSFVLKLARDYAARRMLLEVRPSNAAALGLYAAAGFAEAGVRKEYYPDGEGREDAIVLQLSLQHE
jgi:ribosomal-protein-alanine N-acetyltransferase